MNFFASNSNNMKKLLSTKYSASAFNIAMLILRIGFAGLMIPHGYDKLVHFKSYSEKFISFLGIGSRLSLGLDIFAEFFCAMLVLVGLFTRFATIPLIIAMIVAVTIAHKGLIFSEGEHAALFAVGFFAILLVGPGKISVDGVMGK
jgi:putative oxidoreductase